MQNGFVVDLHEPIGGREYIAENWADALYRLSTRVLEVNPGDHEKLKGQLAQALQGFKVIG